MNNNVAKETFVFSVICVKSISLMAEILSSNYIAHIYLLVMVYCGFELIQIANLLMKEESNFKSLHNLLRNGLVANLLISPMLFTMKLKECNILFVNVLCYSFLYVLFMKTNKMSYNVCEKDLERYGRECVICLEQMETKTELCKMKCRHVFHTACITKHFDFSNKLCCPTCRR